MGIFNFFKKIIKTDEAEEIVSKKLKFSELDKWIEQEISKKETEETEILSKIRGDIENFIKKLEEKIIILKNFDLESKKESERMKKVVNDSRKLYIASVEDLFWRLNEINELKLENFIEKINKIFINFNKSSFKNYERATILIGKEMVSIKEGFGEFSRNLLKTFKENKNITDFFKEIRKIKEKLKIISSNGRILNGIIEKKSNLNKNLEEKEELNTVLEKNLEEIKKSSEYLENISKQKAFQHQKTTLREAILEFKHLIDFKSLANFFHSNSKQMRTVQNYRDDFEISFKRDKGEIILKLINEAKLNNEKIPKKLEEIENKTKEIKNYEKNLGKDETQEVYFKIKKNNSEIEDLAIEKVKDKRREVKLKDEKKELMSELREELRKINIELETL